MLPLDRSVIPDQLGGGAGVGAGEEGGRYWRYRSLYSMVSTPSAVPFESAKEVTDRRW